MVLETFGHRSARAQAPVEKTPPNEGNVSEPSAPPVVKPASSSQTMPTNGADAELKMLRDRRAKAKTGESSKIVESITTAEKKYPNDYRFPYERAKLSITGVTSHHEAFAALAAAAEKAMDNGKAQEMLDSLNADGPGDFYKLSRGHSEWRTLQEALQNKNKAGLKALLH